VVTPEEVIAIIPARGGSKSITHKNLRLIADVPLVAFPIAVARRAARVGRVLASTDDPRIAEVARRYGAETPFLRPAELAADDTRDLPVFEHALRWLEEHEGARPRIVVHLRPTTPFCRVEDVDRGVALLADTPEADAVRMVCAPSQNPYKMWRIGDDGFLTPLVPLDLPEPYNQPRQHLPRAVWQNGVDVTRRETILTLGSMTGRRILPLVSSADDWENWLDIDSPATLEMADHFVRQGRVQCVLPTEVSPDDTGRRPEQEG